LGREKKSSRNMVGERDRMRVRSLLQVGTAKVNENTYGKTGRGELCTGKRVSLWGGDDRKKEGKMKKKDRSRASRKMSATRKGRGNPTTGGVTFL